MDEHIHELTIFMFSLYPFSSASQAYTRVGRLNGHQDAILCLAVSSNQKLLASGGFDGLRIWDLQRMIQLPKPTQMRNPGDPITCVTWLSHENDMQELLCGGSGLGYLTLWRQRADSAIDFDEVFSRRIGTGQEIMSISHQNGEGATRIITGTRDRRAQLWALDAKLNLTTIFSVELPTTTPRALYFHATGIVAFGMYDGEIHTLRNTDGLLLSTKPTGLMMGGVSIDQTGNYFVVDNAVNGFSLHRLEDGACVRSYHMKPVKTYPKQVAFASKGDVVVGGGDSGMAHLFSKVNGKLVQSLRHSNAGRVQTITTHDNPDSSLIVIASSTNEDETHISLWKKSYATPDSRTSPTRLGLRTVFQHLVTVFVALLLIQITNQNFGKDVGGWLNSYHPPAQEPINDVQLLLKQLVAQYQSIASGHEGRLDFQAGQGSTMERPMNTPEFQDKAGYQVSVNKLAPTSTDDTHDISVVTAGERETQPGEEQHIDVGGFCGSNGEMSAIGTLRVPV